MKNPPRKFQILAALIAVMAMVGVWAGMRASISPPAPARITRIEGTVEELLHREIIARFELREASVNDIIAYLNRTFAERPALAHLHAALWTESPPPEFFLEEPGPSAVPSVVPSAEPDEGWVTIALKNVSVSEVILYSSNLAGYCAGMAGNTMYFVKGRGAFGQMVERTWRCRPSDSVEFTRDPSLPKVWLRSDGMKFYAGSETRYLGHDRVRIRNLDHELDPQLYNLEPTLGERLDEWGGWAKAKINYLTGQRPPLPPPLPGPPMLPEPTDGDPLPAGSIPGLVDPAPIPPLPGPPDRDAPPAR